MATEARQVVVTEADGQAAAGQTAVDEGGRCGLCVVAERQGARGEDVCGVTVGVATDVMGRSRGGQCGGGRTGAGRGHNADNSSGGREGDAITGVRQ